MIRIFTLLTCLFFAVPAFAVDEYILPDSNNFVDLRHTKRAICQILYFEPPRDEYRQAGPGIGGDGGRTQGSLSFIGGQIGGFLGGIPGAKVGGLIGSYLGFNLGLGGGPGYVGRIHTPAHMALLGSGVVYAETADSYYVLTAGHVVDRPFYLQFNYAGERSDFIVGKLVQKDYVPNTTIDMATIRFKKADLKGYPKPTLIPIPSQRLNLVGSEVVTVRFGSITHTKVVRGDNGSFDIAAKIHKGNSGSPVFSKDGKHLLGLVLQLDGTCINYINMSNLVRQHNEQMQSR